MHILWNAIRPFLYFTVLVVGSLCFLYLFDHFGGTGEYSAQLEAEVHKVRCNLHIAGRPCEGSKTAKEILEEVKAK